LPIFFSFFFDESDTWWISSHTGAIIMRQYYPTYISQGACSVAYFKISQRCLCAAYPWLMRGFQAASVAGSDMRDQIRSDRNTRLITEWPRAAVVSKGASQAITIQLVPGFTRAVKPWLPFLSC
jgi:hypothetical protein